MTIRTLWTSCRGMTNLLIAHRVYGRAVMPPLNTAKGWAEYLPADKAPLKAKGEAPGYAPFVQSSSLTSEYRRIQQEDRSTNSGEDKL